MWSHAMKLFLTLLAICSTTALAQPAEPQNQNERLPWPDHTRISPKVSVHCSLDEAGEIVLYNYTLESLMTSEQDIWYFDLLTDIEPEFEDGSWSGSYFSDWALRRTGKPSRVSWGSSVPGDRLNPGESISDLQIGAKALPGVTDTNISGWVPLMVVEEVPPERRPIGPMPDETSFVVVKTVGPVFPIETAEQDPAALGGHLVAQATIAQDLGWFPSSLNIPGKLESLQTAIAANNSSLAAAKIAELYVLIGDQDGGITPDGAALLLPSVDFLAAKFPSAEPSTATLVASKDALVYEKSPHSNEGANPRLTLEKINGKAARNLLGFDLSNVSTNSLTRATLVLSIDPSDQVTGWGNGEIVTVKPVTVAWQEGNGKKHGLPGNQQTAGSGAGTTWFSPTDENISNGSANAVVQWSGAATYATTGTAPPLTVHNHQTGELRFDVTQDVLNGVTHGWLLRKDAENKGSKVSFYSRESGANLGPRLILEYDGQTAMSGPQQLYNAVAGFFGFTSRPVTLQASAGASEGPKGLKEVLRDSPRSAFVGGQVVLAFAGAHPLAQMGACIVYRSWLKETPSLA